MSKNLLYDIKLLEDRNDDELEKLDIKDDQNSVGSPGFGLEFDKSESAKNDGNNNLVIKSMNSAPG